jgi:hypothetical protein
MAFNNKEVEISDIDKIKRIMLLCMILMRYWIRCLVGISNLTSEKKFLDNYNG